MTLKNILGKAVVGCVVGLILLAVVMYPQGPPVADCSSRVTRAATSVPLIRTLAKILWETNLGAPVTGYPITYLARGKQYVAVSVGNSLASSSVNRLAEELRPGNASNVFVFAPPQ